MSHCHTAGPENKPEGGTACSPTLLAQGLRTLQRHIGPPAPPCLPLSSLLSVLFLTEVQAKPQTLTCVSHPSPLAPTPALLTSTGPTLRIPSEASTSSGCFLPQDSSSLEENIYTRFSPSFLHLCHLSGTSPLAYHLTDQHDLVYGRHHPICQEQRSSYLFGAQAWC